MSDLPPVAPVSEAEVRERLKLRLGVTVVNRIMRYAPDYPVMLASVGLRYGGGHYYDLQERTDGA